MVTHPNPLVVSWLDGLHAVDSAFVYIASKSEFEFETLDVLAQAALSIEREYQLLLVSA